jgi:RHS repeat-associated protein
MLRDRFKWEVFLTVILLSFSISAHAQRSLPSAYSSNVRVNYVRSWDVVMPITVSDSIHSGTPLVKARMTTQYIDGSYRSVQTVVKKGSLTTDSTSISSSVNAVDAVTSVQYDEFGRIPYQYLSFAANSTGSNTSISDGLFKYNPFHQQVAFYNTQLSGQSGETNLGAGNLNWAYSKTEYEESPLNRTTKSLPPGSSWVGSNRGASTKYWSNTALDSVRIWTVTNASTVGDFGSYATTAMYSAGSLYKTVSEDESGNQVIEFKDKSGNVILKKVRLTATAETNGTGSGHSGWMCTYYIYDKLDQLRAVIQPEGVKALAANSWSLSYNSGVLLTEQCFRYEYDHRGRMIVKKVPGAGEVYMVYDQRNRVVLTQDANLRTGTVKWMYTHYDSLNRSIATGLWTNSSSRATHATAAAESVVYPNLSSQTYEELSNNFYDDYTWLGNYSGHGLTSTLNTTDHNYLLTASNTTYPYPQAPQQSNLLRGSATGSRVKVIGENTYLYTINLYDEDGRVIQTQTKHYGGSIDISTTQYSFSGQPVATLLKHQKSTNTSSVTIATLNTLDELGRVVKIEKNINDDGWKPVSKLEYDALGQLKRKRLGTNPANTAQALEVLNFDYNIRGWILGMNRAEMLTANGAGIRKFGYELGYDKTSNTAGRSYTASLYNGNIAGMIWKSAGDGVRRKYDFTYDAASRLMQGLFEQQNPDNNWGAGTVDYKVKMGDGSDPNTAYDYNGNIKRMQQWGLKLTTSSQIDDLEYNYIVSSNRLKNVRDIVNDTATRLGDFRSSKAYMTSLSNSKTSSATDYAYDNNGNLTQDLNKDISSITYNFLNLPNVVTTTLGTVTFTYDAAGNKLKKSVAETGQSSKTTLYIDGAVYENDVLQFVPHEEGRIRNDSGDFYFDYFIKDHLGNVRMVLTEEQKVDAYPAATMEVADSTDENKFYSNLTATRQSKPWGYPTDNYTDPNDKVAALRGDNNKIGPAIVLKVMAGDKFNVRVSSWYTNFLSSTPDNSYILTDLLNVLTSGVSSTGGKGTASQISATGALNTAVSTFLDDQELEASTSKPMAFLNWILFDEQFKIVESSSGFDQVGPEDQLTIHQFSNLPIHKNGYLYVYVSNASEEDWVYFDNLQVTHTRGPILEETHYYPFGLTMAAISTRAAGSMGKKFGFAGNEDLTLQLGIQVYDFNARTYDQQIGRFLQVDPMMEHYNQEGISPYHYCYNNPMLYTDPDGKVGIIGAIVGAVIGGGGSLIKSVMDEGWGALTKGSTWGKAGVNAAAGAIVGATGTYALGLVATAATTFGTSLAEDAIDGKKLNFGKAAVNGAVSTLFFGFGQSIGTKWARNVRSNNWSGPLNRSAFQQYLAKDAGKNVGQLVDRAVDLVTFGAGIGIDQIFDKRSYEELPTIYIKAVRKNGKITPVEPRKDDTPKIDNVHPSSRLRKEEK